MLRELKRLFYRNNNIFFIVFLVICFSCSNNYKGRLSIIKANKKEVNDIKVFAPDCYFKNDSSIYEIETIYNYDNGVLEELIKPGSESLIYFDIKSELSKLSEYKHFKNLSIERTNKEVFFFNEPFKIKKEINDSIFIETKKAIRNYIIIGKISYKNKR
jgi:hypothetical protein